MGWTKRRLTGWDPQLLRVAVKPSPFDPIEQQNPKASSDTPHRLRPCLRHDQATGALSADHLPGPCHGATSRAASSCDLDSCPARGGCAQSRNDVSYTDLTLPTSDL